MFCACCVLSACITYGKFRIKTLLFSYGKPQLCVSDPTIETMSAQMAQDQTTPIRGQGGPPENFFIAEGEHIAVGGTTPEAGGSESGNSETGELKNKIEEMMIGFQALAEQVRMQNEQILHLLKQQQQSVPGAPAGAAPAPTVESPAAPPGVEPAPEQDAWMKSWLQYQAGSGSQPQQSAKAAPPLKPINPKDVEKPDKYDSSGGWLEWSKTFVRFLDRNDAPHFRWSALLKKIEGLKGRLVT